MRLIQFEDDQKLRQVGVIDGKRVNVVRDARSTRELALKAIRNGCSLQAQIQAQGFEAGPDYRSLLDARRVLAPLDHDDPAHCLISGTGLTHLGSAATRDKMHQHLEQDESKMTDSMQMFRWGLQGGRPEAGTVGAMAATANAVMDALWSRGVRVADMPFTPTRVWQMLETAKMAAE